MTSDLILKGTLGAFFAVSTPAFADQLFNEDVAIIAGQLCVGTDCFDNIPNFPQGQGLRLRSENPTVYFDDTSNLLNEAPNDWQLSTRINGVGTNVFQLFDETNNTFPVEVAAGALSNSLVIAANGRIGLGTTLPNTELEIVSPSQPEITLQQTGTSQSWSLAADHIAMGFLNKSDTTLPFAVSAGAPTAALFVDDTGQIGLGTITPSAALELNSAANFNFFRITAEGASTNESVDIVFTQGPLGTGQLRYNIVEAGDSPQIPEMTLDADGNMALTGTLTTSGSCAVGCDRVFDADYALKSIEDHQAQMWSAGYLPNVGPTPEHGPFNVSDKMGRMLNELEHAHIYIGELHTRVASETQRADRLETQLISVMARLDAIEAQ